MYIFLHIIKFEFLKFLTYPLEILSAILEKFITLGVLIFLWHIIAVESDSAIELRNLIAYFLISEGISVFTLSYDTMLGKFIRHRVREGAFTNILIKPYNAIAYSLASTIGQNGLKFSLALSSFILGLFLIDLKAENIILFLFTLIPAFLIGFAFNMFEGSLSLIFTEVNGIKNAIRHISRTLSGKWIPLFFFGEGTRRIVELLPFHGMVYTPTVVLDSAYDENNITLLILVSIFWAIVLNIFTFFFWKFCIKKYEAVGI